MHILTIFSVLGGMFTYVSGANFFGEIVEWSGFALACWSIPSLSFAVFTALNIGPRAIQHHKYVKKIIAAVCFSFPINNKMLDHDWFSVHLFSS